MELIAATDQRLNQISRQVGETEIGSDFISNIITAMTKIALGERDEEHPERRSLVGLAAPQIGEFVRIILFDKAAAAGQSNFDPKLQFVINPTIVKTSSDEELGREGCYSTGEICAAVYRSKCVVLTGLDENGQAFFAQLDGFQARIAQHEVDHLNGIRCPDRIRSPENLHKVGPGDFQNYRENWANWQKLCPPEDWLKMKQGIK